MKILHYSMIISLVLLLHSVRVYAQSSSMKPGPPELMQLSFHFNKISEQTEMLKTLDMHSDFHYINDYQNINDNQINNIRTHRIISGIGFLTSYTVPLLFDAIAFPDDEYMAYLLIPVIGPYLHLSMAGKDYYWSGTIRGFLIFDAIAQTVFATYFVISLASNPKPGNSKNLTIIPSLNTLTIRAQF